MLNRPQGLALKVIYGDVTSKGCMLLLPTGYHRVISCMENLKVSILVETFSTYIILYKWLICYDLFTYFQVVHMFVSLYFLIHSVGIPEAAQAVEVLESCAALRLDIPQWENPAVQRHPGGVVFYPVVWGGTKKIQKTTKINLI